MACYYPIPAYRDTEKGRPVLWPALGQANMQLPCGKCHGCLVARASEWALRCMHEARSHRYNIFVTLTYDDEHLPVDGTLLPEDLRQFISSLRDHVKGWKPRHKPRVRDPRIVGNWRVRFFACGEYGDRTGRPHYHALLFGLGFTDAKECGANVFHSEMLENIWAKGYVNFGPLNAARAAYTAQYTMKKQNGKKTFVSPDGVVLCPPFLRLSKGIGRRWLERFANDLRHGVCIDREGQTRPIPRAYRKWLKKDNPDLLDEIESHFAPRNTFKTLDEQRQVNAAAEQIAKAGRKLYSKRKL